MQLSVTLSSALHFLKVSQLYARIEINIVSFLAVKKGHHKILFWDFVVINPGQSLSFQVYIK